MNTLQNLIDAKCDLITARLSLTEITLNTMGIKKIRRELIQVLLTIEKMIKIESEKLN